MPVFIVCPKAARAALRPLIVEDTPAATLAGGGHVPHRSFLFEVNQHVASPSGYHTAKLLVSRVKIMSLELRLRERFARRLARFVEKEKARAGCAKTAMKRVASKLGMSMVNVYRAMNGYGPVKIQAHHHAALLMHSLGIVRVAAKIRAKRQASLHA
jgi:hypothetical protein